MSLAQSGKVAFASGKVGDYDIWSLDLATGAMTQLTRGNYWHDKPSWSPDGRWVVFTTNRAGGPGQEIFKVDANGQNLVGLTGLGRWADSPTFSPDGRRIAFISNESGNNDVWIMDADGRNRTQVTRHQGSDNHVRWTPDGRGLYFSSDRDSDADIWHIDLSSGATRQLNEDRGADITPTPSPDGSLIAFCSNRQHEPNSDDPYEDRDKDIWMMGADGSFPVRLTPNQGADFCPCWSPDGNSLLYTAESGKQASRLRVMDVRELRRRLPVPRPQRDRRRRIAHPVREARLRAHRPTVRHQWRSEARSGPSRGCRRSGSSGSIRRPTSVGSGTPTGWLDSYDGCCQCTHMVV